MQIEYTLYGRPKAWARAGSRGGFRFTPPAVKEAQREHKEACLMGRPDGWPMAATYELFVAAHFENAKGLADIDNLAKLVLDGLHGAAYDNDRNVVRLLVERYVGTDEPRTVVIVRCLS